MNLFKIINVLLIYFWDTFQGVKRTMWISWHECRASWLTAWVGQGMGKWDAKSGSQAYHVLWIPLHPDPKYSLHENLVLSYKTHTTYTAPPCCGEQHILVSHTHFQGCLEMKQRQIFFVTKSMMTKCVTIMIRPNEQETELHFPVLWI